MSENNVEEPVESKTELEVPTTSSEVSENNVEVQVYFGQFQEDGSIKNMGIYPMTKVSENADERKYYYEATIMLKSGGNFGYTFRVMPKHEMLLDSENLNLVKWFESEKQQESSEENGDSENVAVNTVLEM